MFFEGIHVGLLYAKKKEESRRRDTYFA